MSRTPRSRPEPGARGANRFVSAVRHGSDGGRRGRPGCPGRRRARARVRQALEGPKGERPRARPRPHSGCASSTLARARVLLATMANRHRRTPGHLDTPSNSSASRNGARRRPAQRKAIGAAAVPVHRRNRASYLLQSASELPSSGDEVTQRRGGPECDGCRCRSLDEATRHKAKHRRVRIAGARVDSRDVAHPAFRRCRPRDPNSRR